MRNKGFKAIEMLLIAEMMAVVGGTSYVTAEEIPVETQEEEAAEKAAEDNDAAPQAEDAMPEEEEDFGNNLVMGHDDDPSSMLPAFILIDISA